MITNFLRIAWRNLLRNRVASSIHLVGLTIGISICIIIFLIADVELNYDKFHPDSERIYRLVGKMKDREGVDNPVGFIPYAVPAAIRSEVTGFETVAAFINFESAVKIPGKDNSFKTFESRRWGIDQAEIVIAEPQYFSIFQYRWIAGNAATALNEPFKVVLTASKAKKYFGSLSPADYLGKEIIYADSIRITVAGIIQDWEKKTDLSFTDIISYSTIRSTKFLSNINTDEWNDLWSASQAFVKLNKTTTSAQLEIPFKAFNKSHFKSDFQFIPALQPLSDLHFNDKYADNYSRKSHLPTILGLIAIAVFILLIAAINFINLSTAQSFQRAKEVGIRKVLGSSRKTLIFQFMSETFILVATAVVIAVLMVPSLIGIFSDFLPPGTQMDYSVKNFGFLLSIALITSCIAGLYPSVLLSSYLPALTLKGKNIRAVSNQGWLRKGLMIFQFTISIIFILVTMLVSYQISFIRNKDLGFNAQAVISLHAPRGPENKLAVLKTSLSTLPGVEDAALQIFEPMGINFGMDKVAYQGKKEQVIDAAYKMGDDHFVSFYNMKLIAGRQMLKSDTAKEFIISESFVKLLGLASPEEALGISLKWRDKLYPVVGVVADFHQQGMKEKIPPTFITVAKNPGNLAIRLKDTDYKKAAETISSIAALWKNVYPDNKFEYTFLDESIAAFFKKENDTSLLVNIATIIAILLSCFGMYGLSVFTAFRRTKEIGIRKVSGASVFSIVALLSREFILVILISCCIAFPVAFYLMREWLADFIYRVDIEWWMFVLSAALAIGIVMLTSGYQSIKAALTNPAKILRTE